MGGQLSPESIDMLRRYESGGVGLVALSDWLVRAEYDEDLSRGERDLLAGIRLTAIEAAEGLCPEADLLKDVASALDTSAPRARRLPA